MQQVSTSILYNWARFFMSHEHRSFKGQQLRTQANFFFFSWRGRSNHSSSKVTSLADNNSLPYTDFRFHNAGRNDFSRLAGPSQPDLIVHPISNSCNSHVAVCPALIWKMPAVSHETAWIHIPTAIHTTQTPLFIASIASTPVADIQRFVLEDGVFLLCTL